MDLWHFPSFCVCASSAIAPLRAVPFPCCCWLSKRRDPCHQQKNKLYSFFLYAFHFRLVVGGYLLFLFLCTSTCTIVSVHSLHCLCIELLCGWIASKNRAVRHSGQQRGHSLVVQKQSVPYLGHLDLVLPSNSFHICTK